MKRPIVYVAHRLGKDSVRRPENIEDAEMWVRFLALIGCAPVASWTSIARGWSEELGRADGLDIDKRLVEVCQAVILCGPELSGGMKIERDHALGCGGAEIMLIDVVGFPRSPALALYIRRELKLPRINFNECWNCKGVMKACSSCGSSGVVKEEPKTEEQKP